MHLGPNTVSSIMPGPRVPLALQNLFVRAQQGEVVDQPPAEATKVFAHKYAKKSKKPRIPLALQSVFLKSQKGQKVVVAPKKVAAKVFDPTQESESGETASVSSASTFQQSRPTAAEASRKAIELKNKTKKKKSQVLDADSPQVFLSKALKERGYSTKQYSSLESAYFNSPTEYQKASYGAALKTAVVNSDTNTLRKLLDAGLSPNPCNNFGESIIHMVCRKGDHRILRVFLEANATLQVTDDFGKTPLHDACWRAEPSFETIALILDNDRNLVRMQDCRGSSPLAYIRRENYAKWNDFLESKLDRFWPKRDVEMEGPEHAPPLAKRKPNSMPVQDPVNALPCTVATKVASGEVSPDDVMDDFSDDDSSFLTEASWDTPQLSRPKSLSSISDMFDEIDALDSDDESSSSGSYSDEESEVSERDAPSRVEFPSKDDDDDDSVWSDSSFSSEESDMPDIDPREMQEFCLRAGGPLAVARRVFASLRRS